MTVPSTRSARTIIWLMTAGLVAFLFAFNWR